MGRPGEGVATGPGARAPARARRRARVTSASIASRERPVGFGPRRGHGVSVVRLRARPARVRSHDWTLDLRAGRRPASEASDPPRRITDDDRPRHRSRHRATRATASSRGARARLVALDGGVIETARRRGAGGGSPRSTRGSRELLDEHGPTPWPLEDLYFGANARSAFAVGQARGVVMLAAGQRGMPCAAYTPQQVKGAVCGSGRADKAPGAAHGRSAAARCPSRRSPTTPPTRSPSPSATPTARRSPRRWPADRPMIALVAGEVAVRRGDHVVVECGGRRLPLRGVGRDAAPRPRRRRAGHAPHPPRRARRRARAVRLRAPRRSATSSCCCSASRPSGPKVALAVLSGGPPRELVAALAAGDVARLQAVPGIGKRTAERIVVELREKVAGEPAGDARRHRRALRRPARARARRRCSGSASRPQRPTAARRRRGRDAGGPDRRRAARERAGERSDARIQTPGASSPRTSSTARCARGAWRTSSASARVKDQLAVSIEAAAARGEALDHVLLAGPPGLGKTSLAQIVAHELDVAVRADRRPGARAQGRRRRLPDRARAAQRVLRRRDPPPRRARWRRPSTRRWRTAGCRSPSARAPARGW